MNRFCFLLQVRPDLLDEYVQRHAQVWPEMLAALRSTGWTNYSIFARPDGLLVGYVEAEDFDAIRKAMDGTEVNGRWQAEMSRFFVGLDGQNADAAMTPLTQIFNLEEQLAATDPSARPTHTQRESS